MISAQVDQVVQEHLIEKYMMLPNQVWDDVISQASKVRKPLDLTRLLHQYRVDTS
jgi:exportin-1